MNRGEAVAAIKRRLGFYTKKTEEIIAELEISQKELEMGVKLPDPRTAIFMPYFLVSEIQSAVTVVNEDRVPVPQAIGGSHDGFLSEVENAALWILDPEAESDDPWIELKKEPFDTLQRIYPGSDFPKGYGISGNYFRLRPIPDDAYTLKIITHNADVVPATDDATNKWLTYAPSVLWAHAGMSIATALRDATALKQFTNTFSTSVMALYYRTEERLHTNQKYVMGGED